MGLSAPFLGQPVFTVSKTLTFTGAAGLGAVGQVPLFTLTGRVYVRIFVAVCTVDLVSGGGGSLSLGTPSSLTRQIIATTATGIDVGEVWANSTPSIGSRELTTNMMNIVFTESPTAEVTVAAITAGTIVFTIEYVPLTADGALVPV